MVGIIIITDDVGGTIAKLCGVAVGIIFLAAVWRSSTPCITVAVGGIIIITVVVGGIIAKPYAAVAGIG